MNLINDSAIISMYEDILIRKIDRFPDGIWQSKENVRTVIRYFVFNKLNISEMSQLYRLKSGDFISYKLSTVLAYVYGSRIGNCIIDCFPEYKFFKWKFNRVDMGFWDIKENRISALKELVEAELKIDPLDIPKILTSSFLKTYYCKFLNVYTKFYNEDFYVWVNEAYPNLFKRQDFYSITADDGTPMKSKEELKIHNFLLTQDMKVKYFSNENSKTDKLFNAKHNENYVPDWLLNDKVIVEYFGLYAPHRNTKFSMKYVKRTHRKIEFYQKYCDENPQYFFIAIFPEDIVGSMDGLKEKTKI